MPQVTQSFVFDVNNFVSLIFKLLDATPTSSEITSVNVSYF